METKELLENISNLCATAIPAPQEFNIFRICGIAHYELRHSAIIAEFLNPEGSHGCKAFFLRHFFDTIGIEYKNVELENAKIYTEYATTCGRFDIFIDLGNKSVIIENKVYASEGNGQLASYRQYLDKHKGGDLIYLTLRGEKSSDPHNENIKYKAISYDKEIISWLEQCIKTISVGKIFLLEYLAQYKQLIKSLIWGNEMDDKNLKNLIDSITANTCTFNGALCIVNNIYKVKHYLIETLAKKATPEGWNCETNLDRDGKIWSYWKYTNVQYPFEIFFEFSGNNFTKLYYGLSTSTNDEWNHILSKIKKDEKENLVKKVEDFFSNINRYKFSLNPYWIMVSNKEFPLDDNFLAKLCGTDKEKNEIYANLKKSINELIAFADKIELCKLLNTVKNRQER